MKSLTLKTKNWGNYQFSRRFGRYSFPKKNFALQFCLFIFLTYNIFVNQVYHFGLFMNCSNISLQTTFFCKFFGTNWTFMWLLFDMNAGNVLIQNIFFVTPWTGFPSCTFAMWRFKFIFWLNSFTQCEHLYRRILHG